ncbi:DNA circulation family protein [Pandoraea anapnoica]|uniref:DNA circulation family protein n=1 Tax=Pandoraea anapnoica TaxID=2508301 RepID=A0A5E5ASR5_9BURK|nr:DNA circularization N-terminal domain-containing protein [Pandoraea anapnoica]VVE76338.1 DNA circulation family protein [Pandoraea anapnoica]
MAWSENLFDASFRGVPFECLRADDTLDRSVSRYKYPNVDGEDIEDLGQKAREVSMTAVLFGDDYETQMRQLLNALATKGPAELIHPIFGSMPDMQFLGGHVSHDAENRDSCRIDMKFAASKPGNLLYTGEDPPQKADATAQLANDAQSAASGIFGMAVDALKAAKAGMQRLNAFRDNMLDTVSPLRSLVIGFKTVGLDYLAFPSAFASDMIGLTSGMNLMHAFSDGLEMSDWNALGKQSKSVVSIPAAAAKGETVVIPGTPNANVVTDTPFDPTAPYSPPQPSAVVADPSDVQLVTMLTSVIVASQTTQVASDVLANQADTPTLTPDQIEQIADDTRGQIQDAIDLATTSMTVEQYRPIVEPLKDAALSLQQLTVSVMDAMPPIITRTVPMDTNLTLLAFDWYGDAQRSAELLRLNPALKNPNFITRGEVLRGFAR